VIRIQTLGGLSVRGTNGGPLAGAAAQPRRMAILALLARAGERGVSRDKLLALLWPDADADRGSRTLAQALYALRKDLVAEDAIAGSKELRFDPALVSSDVSEFASAVARGDDARAAELYGGPFLDGFHLSGAEEFSRWVDRERAVVAQDHARALESLARRALASGDASASVGWWRRLAALEPLNARVTVGLMEALTAAGERAGAIKHARVYELLVEQELDLPPDKEVTALADRLRAHADDAHPTPTATQATIHAVTQAPAATIVPDRAPPEPEVDLPPIPEPTAERDRGAHRVVTSSDVASTAVPPVSPARPWLLAAMAVVAVAAGVLATRSRLSRVQAVPNDSLAVVAVGQIVSYGSDSLTSALAGPVGDLLATSLARSPRLRVLSAGRMLELMRRSRTLSDTGVAGFTTAARNAGATEVIDGTLYARPDGNLRLDLRRVDLATGSIRDVNSVEGSDLFTLVDSGTARLLAAHGGAVPAGSIAGVTTHSAPAYRFYVEGLKMLFDGDAPGAERLLAAALREDSTFAMAAYYYARTSSMRVPMVRRLNLARRLSANATERERLLIQLGWAQLMTSPDLRVLADSFVRRYPQETEGHLYAGIARSQEGEFMAALPPLQRVMAMDSLAFARGDSVVGCDACTAIFQIIMTNAIADSLAAAEREGRRWTRLQPNIPGPWIALWDVLERAGKFADADKVSAHLATLDDDAVAAMTRAATHALRTGDLTTGERIVRTNLEAGNSAAQREALWQLVLSLRYQGRMKDAVVAARRYRALVAPLDSAMAGVVSTSASPLATAMFEAGRYREAAMLFDSVSRWRPPEEAPSGAARERVWRLTQEARALASAGDTTAVAALADTIGAVGASSGHVRDRRLDRYVRGLVLLARNDLVGAEAAFRSALYSLPAGYTRVNCELGDVLLRLGRPRDAVAVLQPALRGKVDASNYYVTHTEVHALLARAWDAAGRADSAAAHYAWVARAWEHGDPPFAQRAAEARRRASALGWSGR
jgi:DNA-binding SARP family transcriptional activator/tetratricopeptide (TPR) repeat protein